MTGPYHLTEWFATPPALGYQSAMTEDQPNPTATRILDIAEDGARTGGYAGFSFREIAKEIGIKPASVHYHFPAKADLATVLMRRYTDTLLAGLGNSEDAGQPADALLAAFVAEMRRRLAEEDLLCLGAVFGAECASLPLDVAAETRDFFARVTRWLVPLFARRGARDPEGAAMEFLARIHGAMIQSHAHGALDVYDRIAARALAR
ncbi:TetR/AcrR family transcriptional regulator [Ovoidimarina sediminis]|uniref:TetR/AcrR family transcriptional regulator n=1 Tax=Ovoidimarina sediminis TaxID=3079856 RepID=UPI002912461B|nr:TetR/AcrR family transcriptional regulator [Rhodophyticola sp. MJ-SS7]MDU8945915.1 TetR/AcrR family transcriptional regulator [Rhodophyticola sp. MJ-SS7]